MYNTRFFAGVAQLVEQLICNQPVAGSSPISSSKEYKALGVNLRLFYCLLKSQNIPIMDDCLQEVRCYCYWNFRETHASMSPPGLISVCCLRHTTKDTFPMQINLWAWH